MLRKVALAFVVVCAFSLLSYKLQPATAQRARPGGAPPPGSGNFTVTGFIRVIDGNSIDPIINGQQSGVRFIGYTAPSDNTPCGRQATNQIRALVKGGVQLNEDPTLTFDPHNLRLYYGLTLDGRSIALALVQAGLARANGTGSEASQLAQAQANAQANHTGCLWSGQVTGGERFAPRAASPAAAAATAAPSTTLPSGFSQDVLASGLFTPTAMAFLPDGRILIAEQPGIVVVYKNGQLLSTPFIDVQSEVNAYWDHGLLGIVADPQFASNGYVYLLYTYENNANDFEGTKTARLTRVTAVGDTASPTTEVTILGKQVGSSCDNFPVGADCIPSDYLSHSIGKVMFAPDGTLWLTAGEGASFDQVDDRALRAQSLDSLGGKLLHIDTNGNGLSTNPFYTGDPTANRSKIWAYGLRNPFRFTLRPGDGTPFVGDVGWDTWEEVDVATRGANLGWPCYEGAYQQAGYAAKATCQTLYAQGSSAVQMPLYAWDHSVGSEASVAGTFYTGSLFPTQYQGTYFFGDYAGSWIKTLQVGANDNLVPGSVQPFATNADGPVNIEQAPDGSLYYISISTGQLRRIRYTGANTPPTAVATATPTAGLAPLAVSFSSSGSSDPNGGAITYSWNFGDGSAADTTANPSHTYAQNGNYTAVLTVTNSKGLSSTAQQTITVGNRPPTATITAPSASLTYKVGDTISYSGTGTDPEDGTEPAANLSWQILLHHCLGSSCHLHYTAHTTGSSGTLVVPDHDDNTWLEFQLTVTDSGGLTSTASVSVYPQKVNLSLGSSPSGETVVYNGTNETTPVTIQTNAGASRTVYAPSPQGEYVFSSWSDGQPQQHNITLGSADATYTATFSFNPAAAGLIYHDSEASGWQAWSWSASVDDQNTSPVFSGSDSIKLSIYGAYGGLELHTDAGLNTTPYTALRFEARSSQAGTPLAVVLIGANNTELTNPVPLNNYGGAPPTGSWQQYTVPLADLGGANQTIYGIAVQDAAGKAEPDVFIDEVQMVTSSTGNGPQIASISPTSGPAAGGTQVTINGSGYSAAGGQATQVKFGNSPATNVQCASTAQCTAVSPSGSGTVDVTVTVAGQTSPTSASDRFSYVSKLAASAPATATAGTSFSLTLTAEDAGDATIAGYRGTVHFTSSDGQAALPADYTFTSGDAGSHTFAVTLKTAGTQTIVATDTSAGSLSGQASVAVSATSTAPGTPTLTAPAEGATSVSLTPTLQWTAPTGAVAGTTQYTAYLLDAATNAMKFQQQTTQLSITVPASAGLVNGHYYFMSVQACNGTACGPAARWEGFTTVGTLGAPGLVSPVEGASGVSLTPTLQWTAPSNAVAGTTYTAYVWDPTPRSYAFQGSTTALQLGVPQGSALQAGHFYYYSVQACTGASCGPLARWEGFTTIGTPGAPGLTQPVEGSTNVSVTPTIQWTAPTNALGGTTQYTAYVWDPSASVMKFQQTTTALQATVPASAGLVLGHFYYFSVQACNGTSCGPLARWEGFTTTSSIGTPVLTAPAEGATGVSLTPTFTWNAASGAASGTQYTLYVWDPALNSMRYQATTPSLSVTVPASSALAPQTFYYYSVQACTGASCGPLARWEGFTTGGSASSASAVRPATHSGLGVTALFASVDRLLADVAQRVAPLPE